MNNKSTSQHQVTSAGLLITLGIIYGDIGTSPLYVLKAICGTDIISSEVILGGLSCIFWALTLQTTLKYVVITLKADNHGEGGIFALYALLRRMKKRWLILPAIIGGSALLADGLITPPISVSSAIEGLRIIYPHINTIPIIIGIIFALFFIQQFGTRLVGVFFGPVMMVWFIMLGISGFTYICDSPSILKAINPYYAYKLLVEHEGGFWLLGSVFLCTTGAEALYSDLGHCGKKNIRISWVFVKCMLLINYFGQGAWLLSAQGQTLHNRNPFYMLMPEWFLPVGVFIATAAAIVASQALISGSFTLINEAIRLNFWPKVRINYPTIFKGQLYIPSVNWLLCAGCIGIVLHFKESSNMEAAYGLAIVITMIMTTLLLVNFLVLKRYPASLVWLLLLLYLFIEGSFLVANLSKFHHGGWITLAIASLIMLVMVTWFQARKTINRFVEFTRIDEYKAIISELSRDRSIDKYATHLVYLTSADRKEEIEKKVIYSILQKQPKKADIYWFIHIDVVDEPYCGEYIVTTIEENKIIRIDFRLGFREDPKVNVIFRHVVNEMTGHGEVDISSRYESLHKQHISGDFRFVVMKKFLSNENELTLAEQLIMNAYFTLKRFSLAEEKAFGLDTSNIEIEKVPLILTQTTGFNFKRIYK